MRYDSGQFGSFDGKDNRRELMVLFQRLGRDLPAPMANERRAQFLRRLCSRSTNGFSDKAIAITPVDAVQAYQMFVQITGVLGVDIDHAARMLEKAVGEQ